MTRLRYAEVFAGAGGLSLGLERANWECAWHAEWDEFPRRVLRHRFPGVPLYGDVTELDGRELVRRHGAIDLLSGGSPCQDLSQAGRRAGIVSGSRSSLFFTQMQLWEETGAPYCLWENVLGALSSGKGEDFRYVLSAFVGADVGRAVDRKGRVLRWANSGVVRGPSGTAAYRVLDAQYWGVPQRRRRVFVLGARTGGVDPFEVLSELEGLCWHHPACSSSGESSTLGAGPSAGDTGPHTEDGRDAAGHHGCGSDHCCGRCTTDIGHTEEAEDPRRILTFDWQAGSGGNDHSFRGKSRSYIVRKGEYTGSLQAVKRDAVLQIGEPGQEHTYRSTEQDPKVLSFYSHSNGEDMNRERMDIAPPVTVGSNRDIPSPPAVVVTGIMAVAGVPDKNGRVYSLEALKALVASTPHVLSFQERGRPDGRNLDYIDDVAYALTAPSGGARTQEKNIVVYDARGNGDGDIANTLVGDHQRRVSDFTAIVFDTKQSGESTEGVAPTLRAMAHADSHSNGGGQLGVVASSTGHGFWTAGPPTGTLRANAADPYEHVVVHSLDIYNQQASEDVTHTLCGRGSNGGGNGHLVPVVVKEDSTIVFDKAQITHPENRSSVTPDAPCPSISATSQLHVARMRAFGDYEEDGTVSAIKARDYKDATDLVIETQQAPPIAGTLGGFSPSGGHRGDLDTSGAYPVTFGVPRRLLPIETERLMAWPDGWTNVPDEKGKLPADAPRYKAVGNGVVSHCVEFIGNRLAQAERLRRERERKAA